MCKLENITYVNYFLEVTHKPELCRLAESIYKERDEDKAERNFKNSKSVSAAYKLVSPRIDLLESREKQKPDDVDFFLSLLFKMLKKSLGSEGILNFKGRFSLSLISCWMKVKVRLAAQMHLRIPASQTNNYTATRQYSTWKVKGKFHLRTDHEGPEGE